MAAQTFQARSLRDGKTVAYTPGSAKAAGDVVVQSTMVGVAVQAIAANVKGALAVEGVFRVVKVTGAISAGDAVYWDADGDPVGGTAGTGGATTSADSGNNKFMGKAESAALSGDATVDVIFSQPATVTAHNPLTSAIADPGDGGAIPVTESGYCPLVTLNGIFKQRAISLMYSRTHSLCWLFGCSAVSCFAVWSCGKIMAIRFSIGNVSSAWGGAVSASPVLAKTPTSSAPATDSNTSEMSAAVSAAAKTATE